MRFTIHGTPCLSQPDVFQPDLVDATGKFANSHGMGQPEIIVHCVYFLRSSSRMQLAPCHAGSTARHLTWGTTVKKSIDERVGWDRIGRLEWA